MGFDDAQRVIAAAARGDSDAINTFVRSSQPDVWRFLGHLVDPGSADDLTQETYLRALRALSSFRGESSVRTWLLTIARRVAADELRRRGRRAPTQPLIDDVAHPCRLADTVAIRDAVRRLPLERREPFVLTQIIGLSYDETATLLGCPIGTIRSRVARAREDLVTAISEAAVTDARAHVR